MEVVMETATASVACIGCEIAQRVVASENTAYECTTCRTRWEPAEDGCPGCIEARAHLERLKDSHGHRNAKAWVRCDECNRVVALSERGTRSALDLESNRERSTEMRLRRRAMLDEFDNLARWRPYLEGRGTEPSPIVGDGNRGGGAKTSATDRPDYVNEHAPDLARAIETDRRLELLAASARVDARVREALRTPLGRRVRQLRETRGWTPVDLADRMNAAARISPPFTAKSLLVLEDTPGLAIAEPTLHALAATLGCNIDDLRDALTRDDAPPPTALERGIAVLQWLATRSGVQYRSPAPREKRNAAARAKQEASRWSDLVYRAGMDFGARHMAEERTEREAELARRRAIVPITSEQVATERAQIVANARESLNALRDERRELERLQHAISPISLQMARDAHANAVASVLAQKVAGLNALRARVAESRQALTPAEYVLARHRLPRVPNAEETRALGIELLELAERVWSA